MLAACGCGWYETLEDCANEFLEIQQIYEPNHDNVKTYKKLFEIYQKIYQQTKELNVELMEFKNL